MRSILERARFCALALCGVVAAGAVTARAAIITGPIVNPANGHGYYLLSQNTWTASQVEAASLGGNLVTINDAAENAFVFSTFSSFDGVGRNLWTGFYDTNQDVNSPNRTQRRLEFAWISGEPVTYSNWSSIEPNALGTTDPNGWEYYVHVFYPGDPNAAKWNNATDTTVSVGRGLFGVVEVVPEPSVLCGAAVLLPLIRRHRR